MGQKRSSRGGIGYGSLIGGQKKPERIKWCKSIEYTFHNKLTLLFQRHSPKNFSFSQSIWKDLEQRPKHPVLINDQIKLIQIQFWNWLACLPFTYLVKICHDNIVDCFTIDFPYLFHYNWFQLFFTCASVCCFWIIFILSTVCLIVFFIHFLAFGPYSSKIFVFVLSKSFIWFLLLFAILFASLQFTWYFFWSIFHTQSSSTNSHKYCITLSFLSFWCISLS